MATSYANTGGTGNRTSIITVTLVGSYAGTPSILVNGDLAANNFWFGGGSLTITFQFSGNKRIIDEAKFYQQNTTSHGTWKWQGSDNGTTWTDIGGTFTLGGATVQTITSLAGNTTAYQYYRATLVSGSTSSSPYVYEFEFKIEDGAAIVLEALVAQLVVETAVAQSVAPVVAQMVVETAALQAAAGVVIAQVVVETAVVQPAAGVEVAQMVVEVAVKNRPGETAIMIFD